MQARVWHRWRRGTAGLGLLALVLQLVLSFGHIHVHDVNAAPSPQTHKAIVTAISSGSGQDVPGAPADDDCPICMAMHAVATGVLPAPPTVIVDTAFSQVLRTVSIDAFKISTARYTLAQTRAPPKA
jgi:hypothetical protein